MKDAMLDILVATHGEDGLKKVEMMNLPVMTGVRYIVTVQGAKNAIAPASLQRNDISIHYLNSSGLSNNRNAGIGLSTAQYCLLADNDLRYTADRLNNVVKTISANPEVDIFTFRHEGENVSYPKEETDFSKSMPKGYSVTSFEIAFRRKAIGELRFDKNFGIGAPMGCCEEALFILDCQRSELCCRFFPITIVEHHGLSTGHRPITDASVAQAEGAYIRLAYGIKGFSRIPLFAWRSWRRDRMPLLWGLRFLIKGFFSQYVREHNNIKKKRRS